MKRIVVKVGTAVLTEQNRIAKERMQNLIDFIAELKTKYEVILVSSGAVAAGYNELKLDKKLLSNRQALASMGQPILLSKYRQKFEKHHIIVSQILVTAANFHSQDQESRVKNTIETLLRNGVLPIINENDATATEELEVGDNDQLSAYACEHFGGEMLVILSDIDAYYDADPRKSSDAKVLKTVTSLSSEELEAASSAHSEFATGGIVTKLKAADYMLKKEKSLFLSSGFDLSDARSFLLDGNHQGGTYFTTKAD